MSNGWTGGQYSLVRAGLGLGLAVCLARAAFDVHEPAARFLSSWPDPFSWSESAGLRGAASWIGAALALAFAVGWHDRLAVLGAGYVWISLVAAGAVERGPAPAAALALVVLHLGLPTAPYGSVAARGRLDPRGGWRFPASVQRSAWLLLVAAQTVVAADRLSRYAGGSGTVFASIVCPARNLAAREGFLGRPHPGSPEALWWVLVSASLLLLCLSRRTRPWAWLGLLSIQLAAPAVSPASGSGPLMLVLLLFAFDPGWIPAYRPSETDRVFYDGACGLCHRSVRFLLAEERHGSRFRFAPLRSAAFERLVPQGARAGLPDSIVLRRPDGTLLTRSAAVLLALRRLGGLWRPLARLGSLIPRLVRDGVYDAVAAVRHRLFARPDTACPRTPAELLSRFDLDGPALGAAPAAEIDPR